MTPMNKPERNLSIVYLAIAVLSAPLYVASVGPVSWLLYRSGRVETSWRVYSSFYAPLKWIAENGPASIGRVIESYRIWGAPRDEFGVEVWVGDGLGRPH